MKTLLNAVVDWLIAHLFLRRAIKRAYLKVPINQITQNKS